MLSVEKVTLTANSQTIASLLARLPFGWISCGEFLLGLSAGVVGGATEKDD